MQADLKATQMELEHMYNKNQLVSRIRQEFKQCEQFDFAAAFGEIGVPEKLGFAILTQLAIHKRANLPTMVGCLRHEVDYLSQATDALERMSRADFIDWDPEQELFIVKLDITADVQREVDTYQFPLPMIVKHRAVEDNFDTGYLTARYSILLKNNHHDGDVCLDHINRINSIPLSVDVDVANMVHNQWKGLDKQKDDETRQDFLRRVKAFKKYDETAHTVMSILVNAGNRFFLTHAYDKRGRTYAKGYHISYQGNDWNKSTICFADGEIVK